VTIPYNTDYMVTAKVSSSQPIVRVRVYRFDKPGQAKYVPMLRCKGSHQAGVLVRRFVELAASWHKRVGFEASIPMPAYLHHACPHVAGVTQRAFGVTAWIVQQGAEK
jgi:hypothetical protein